MTIGKGNHRPYLWWLYLKLYFFKRSITRKVTFGRSNYHLPDVEKDDVNKLFGIGYLWSHHKDSARFGWNYGEGKIKIYAYCYVNGERIIKWIGSLSIGYTVTCRIEVQKNRYIFSMIAPNGYTLSTSIPFTHKKKIGYWLGLYFGGNLPAPNVIEVEIKRK